MRIKSIYEHFLFTSSLFLLSVFFTGGCSNAKMQVSSLNAGVLAAPGVDTDKTSYATDTGILTIEGTCEPEAIDLEINIENKKWNDDSDGDGDGWISASAIDNGDSDLDCSDGHYKIQTTKDILIGRGISISDTQTDLNGQIRQKFLNGPYSNPTPFTIKLKDDAATETETSTDAEVKDKIYFVDGVLPVSFVDVPEPDTNSPLGFLPMTYMVDDDPTSAAVEFTDPASSTFAGLKYFFN